MDKCQLKLFNCILYADADLHVSLKHTCRYLRSVLFSELYVFNEWNCRHYQ